MANAIVNTLIFNGTIAGTAAIQAQGIAGNLTFQLPNLPPNQGQLLAASAVNGTTIVLGWANIQSNIPLSSLGQSGATTGQIIEWNGSAWVPSTTIPGEGTVTSVALTAPVEFTIGGSPITTSGTLAITKATQTQNTVWAGPTSGSAVPTFRALVLADLPAINFSNLTGSLAVSQINSKQGNGNAVQLTNTGATVTGDVVTYDANSNVVDSGTLLSSLAPKASPTFTGLVTISGTSTFSTANPTFFSSTGSGAVVLGTTPTISAPTISGHPTIEGVTSTGATGTGAFVFATSPTLVTPTLGVASATSVAIGGGTALATSNQTGTGSLVLATSPTISAPTISGHPTVEGVTSTGATGTGAFVFATSPTLVTPTLGAAAATSLTLSSTISNYNSQATAGNGIASVVGSTSQKSEAAADANVLTFTPPASAGSYRVRFVLSVSASSAAILGWTATWTDSNGNAQTPTNLALFQSGVALPALTFTNSGTANFYGHIDLDVNNAGTAVVVKFTLTGGTITAKASANVERII